MNKAKLIQRLQTAHELIEASFADMSPEDLARIGTLEHWAPKDVLGHMTAWQKRWLVWLEPIGAGQEPASTKPGAAVTDENAANAETFYANQYRGYDELLDESRQVLQRLLTLLEFLSEEDIADPQRFPGLTGRPFWKAVSGNFCWHVQVHLGYMFIEREQVERGEQIVEALAALVDADEPISERGEALYNLACYYSLAGMRSKAIEHLKPALALNPDLVEWSKKDTDLDPLRAEADFQAVYQMQPAHA